MRILSFYLIGLYTLTLGLNQVSAQSTFNKVGGVAFRVDDQQTAAKWRDFNAVFAKYGYHFSLGLDAQRILFDTAALNALREVAANGNELMDHTPYGSTIYLYANVLKDTMRFYGNPAVDHINKNLICLKVDSIYTENLTGEGPVDLIGNMLISKNAGEFKNMYSPAYYSNLYLPSKNKLCGWYGLQNANSNDPDTLLLRTYWQETFPLDTAYNIPHHRLSGYDIKMTDKALNLLCDLTRYIYDSLNLTRPKTWIQPGGAFTQLNAYEVKKRMGQNYGYTAAATYVNQSYKMYNEVDSLGIKRFALQNPDFSDESSYFKDMITTIADNSARHIQSFTLSHFLSPVGGWAAYIGRIDSLLAWCKVNDIPVRTVNEWASILFDSVPNPYANAIPELYKDYNYNGIPDGYTGPFGTFDSTDGVARSKFKCMTRTTSGNYFTANIMGGVEKGWNRISAYTKGMSGDSIRISISLNELSGSNKFYNLASNTSTWQEVSQLVYIDPKASRVTIQFNAVKNNIPGTMKISGMQMRKQSVIKVDPAFASNVLAHKPFDQLASSLFVFDSAYLGSEYKLRITVQPKQLTILLDTLTNKLQIKKPSIFWTGRDSIKVSVLNNDGFSDSAYIRFVSTNPSVCIGDSIFLSADQSFGSNFSWQGKPAGLGFWAKPLATTSYVLNYTNLSSQPATATLQLNVDQVKPQITLTNDTIICRYQAFTLTVPNTGKIVWYNELGNTIKEGNSVTLPAMISKRRLYISNRINSCITWDTININLGLPRQLAFNITQDTTKINTSKVVAITNNTALSGTLLNVPVNKFVYSSGNVVFNPNLNFIGRDSALFHFTDNACSHDTVWVKMLVKNNTLVPSYNVLDGIHVYPNPVKNELSIEILTKEEFFLTLSDMTGRIIWNKAADQKTAKIDMSMMLQGMYLLRIETSNGTGFLRVIKE